MTSRPPRPARASTSSPLLLSLSLSVLLRLRPAGAVLPTASLDVYSTVRPVAMQHLSVAKFGPSLPMGPRGGVRPGPSSTFPSQDLALAPADDEMLCNEADGVANYTEDVGAGAEMVYDGEIVLVPRGGCTFERKVLSAQRLGAGGAVIYNNLGSRYGLNETAPEGKNGTNATSSNGNDADLANSTHSGNSTEPSFEDIIWPKPKHDYDCSFARADVPKSVLSFDPLPYNSEVNDPLLTGSAGEGNLCALHNNPSLGGAGEFVNRCASRRCLLTGREDEDTGMMEACCAWDIHIDMNGDGTLNSEGAEVVDIPSLFASMGQASWLLAVMEESGAVPPVVNSTNPAAQSFGVSGIMYTRWYPSPNASSFLLWMLGTFVTWVASYLSAKDYRNFRKKSERAVAEGRLQFTRNRGRRGGGGGGGGGGAAEIDDGDETVASEDDAADEREEREANAAAVGAGDGSSAAGSAAAAASGSPTALAFRGFDAPAAATGGRDAFEQEEEGVVDPEGADKRTMATVAAVGGGGGGGGGSSMVGQQHFEDEPLRDSVFQSSMVSPAPAVDEEAPLPPGVPLPERAPEQQQQGQEQEQQQQQTPSPPTQTGALHPPNEALELNAYHVAAFIVFASAALFVLFFFKIYTVVRIMYGLGCSGAMAQVVFTPLYGQLARGADWLRGWTGKNRRMGGGRRDRRVEQTLKSSICPKFTFCGCNEFNYLGVLAVLSGYAVGVSWLYVGFTRSDPDEVPFYWIAQDVMGAGISIAFLGLIRLNSIKIATILLVAMFIYDIFFVFITPYLFDGDSIMITVATSGGPPDADPDYCEKYHDEKDCQGGDPLPMLLTVPRVNDFRGGSNLLGLGDIVLPGLLISFAARLDAASLFVRFCSSAAAGAADTATTSTADSFSKLGGCLRSFSLRELLCGSYLTVLTMAYAVGLIMANIAVILTRKGQPALLYLVPACLGTIVVVGKVRGELRELWRGPDVLKKADRLLGQLSHIPTLRGGPAGASPASNVTGGEAPRGEMMERGGDESSPPPSIA